MKKLFLFALTSISLSCIAVPIRIQLAARDGRQVPLIGEYKEAAHNKNISEIRTPFGFIENVIDLSYSLCKTDDDRRSFIQQCSDDPSLLEWNVAIDVPVDFDILSCAVYADFDIDKLDQHAITRLINVYDFLRASPRVIDVLIKRSVALAIEDPLSCPFAADTRENNYIPNNPTDDHDVIRNAWLIQAAREYVAQRFGKIVLPYSPWPAETLMTGLISDISYSPSGRFVVTAYNKQLSIWDLQTEVSIGNPIRIPIRTIETPKYLRAVDYLPGGRFIVATSAADNIYLYDAETGNLIHTFSRYLGHSPDGRFIVEVSDDGIARIWDIQTQTYGFGLEEDADLVNAVEYSPDGKFIAINVGEEEPENQIIHIYNTQTGLLVRELEGEYARWSPDSRFMVTMLGHVARVWDVQTGMQVCVLGEHTHNVDLPVYSPDGRSIMTGADGLTGCLWDAQTGAPICIFEDVPRNPNPAKYSPDGRFILIKSTRGACGIWDVQTGRKVFTFPVLITSALWSPDSRNIATIVEDDFWGTNRKAVVWRQEWNRDTNISNPENTENLLHQLLMLRVTQNQFFTPDEVERWRPIYNQLPTSLQEWVNGHTNVSWTVGAGTNALEV